ncbi:MAG: hypothetical protein LWY06_06680 [Firmicutes bacterium]|nr:hypothetical protein [Bacillota bacterium]
MTSVYCIFIILLQSVIFFWLLELPLSLWNVHPVVAAAGALLFLIAQFKLSHPVYKLFFQVKLEEESEEDLQARKNKENDIGSFININGVKCDTILFRESHPLILSFGSLGGEKTMVVSTGLVETLNEKELEVLMLREIYLMKRKDLGFFSAAAFLPFVILAASFWMTDAAKESRIKKGAGTSFLAGGILFHVYRAAAFLLMPLSKKRHRDADMSVLTGKFADIETGGIIEKIGRAFCLPVKSGPPFRKKIYMAMHPLMPFDPLSMQDLLVWKNWLDIDVSLSEIDKNLMESNAFYRRENMFSSHDSLSRRFNKPESRGSKKNKEIKLPFDTDNLKYEMFLGYLPAFFFAEGVIITLCLSGLFGIPLIFLGSMILIRLTGEIFKIKKSGDAWFDMGRVTANGKVEAQFIENIIEAPWFFLNNGKTQIPLVLRQILRNDDSLLDFATDEVEVEGVFKTRNIPYIDISKITKQTGKNRTAAGGYYGMMFMIALCLIFAGVLMIAIEVVAVR